LTFSAKFGVRQLDIFDREGMNGK